MMPGINIFLLIPSMMEEKKERKLSDVLKKKKDEEKDDMMLSYLKKMTDEMKALPKVAHSGGG